MTTGSSLRDLRYFCHFSQRFKRWAKVGRPSGARFLDFLSIGLLENEFSRTRFGALVFEGETKLFDDRVRQNFASDPLYFEFRLIL